MALTSTTDQEAEQRWAAARGLAEGVPDPHLPGRRRRLFTLLLAILVIGWISGAALAFLLPQPTSASSDTETGAFTGKQVVGYVLAAVGFVIGIVSFIWMKRTGRYITRWRQAISPLNRRERKWVIKQLRGKITPDPSKMDILLTIAKQSRATTEGVIPLWAAPALMTVGLAIASDVDMLRWLHLLTAGLLTMAAVLMAVEYRRWGTFIDKHDNAPHTASTALGR